MSEIPHNSEETKPNETAPETPEESLISEAHIEKSQEPEASTISPESQPRGLRKFLTNDFLIGVGLSILILIISITALGVLPYIEFLVFGLTKVGDNTPIIILMGTYIVILAVNILVLIIMAIVRRRIFFGMLAGCALLFILALLAGIFLMAACYISFPGLS
jgi:magnesium-transporting ATPase (P-type)